MIGSTTVNVDNYINVSSPAYSIITVESNQRGYFGTASANIAYGTNSELGCKLTMEAREDTGGKLRPYPASLDGQTFAQIPSITSSTTVTAAQIAAHYVPGFQLNAWGYALGSTSGSYTFQPIPLKGNAAQLADIAQSGMQNQEVVFGANINNETPGVNYATTLIVSAVINGGVN